MEAEKMKYLALLDLSRKGFLFDFYFMWHIEIDFVGCYAFPHECSIYLLDGTAVPSNFQSQHFEWSVSELKLLEKEFENE